MKNTLLILALVCTSAHLRAQQAMPAYFTSGDTIQVVIGQDGLPYYSHTIEKGHTLYGLASLFGISVRDLTQANGGSSTLALGQRIAIPIQVDAVDPYGERQDTRYIPVTYTVKPKDNLYRVSKGYFQQSMDLMIQRNNLATVNLEIGQTLTIGWMPLGKIVKNPTATPTLDVPTTVDPQIREDKIAQLIDSIQNQTEVEIPDYFAASLLGQLEYSPDMDIIETKMVACWDKNIPDNGSVFVMNDDARKGSLMELYNPVLKRSIRAKVLGPVPVGAYPADVKLILSPRAAKLLRGLDSRFGVSVKFIE